MSALSDYFFEQAQQAINTVDPIPLAPISPPCVTGEAQDNNREPAGSPLRGMTRRDEVWTGEASHGRVGSGLERCGLVGQGMVPYGDIDWATDTRPSHRLSDAELIAKMAWQLNTLNTAQRLQREFEKVVPTVYPKTENNK